ncbi:hypothetical protein CTAYLR_000408 [Chrysophaeum taylorii]|uniref:Hydroxylamine reductase n=1 Tax=Chrysophaeum taylorii TaxID=2483200 RepID=A0AAD7UI57_9STRA|nr:hypothetical protein CTAYLR_000408 [Chrysophaeum taylorii]
MARVAVRGFSQQQAVRKRLLIIYGSQTGTAESLARMLGPQALGHNFEPIIEPMNDAIATLKASEPPAAIACVCSTYGVGEFPSNAERFFGEVNRAALPGLRGVPYSILGLGDSRNEHYNAAAKALDGALRKAGAVSAQKLALSCETKGHDSAYREWKRGLWKALGSTVLHGGVPSVVYECRPVPTAKPEPLESPYGFEHATVASNEVVSAPGYAPVFRKLRFEPMDRRRPRKLNEHVMVLPQNGVELVERAARRLDADLDSIVRVVALSGAPKSHIDGKNVDVRTLLSEVIDLSGIPPRSFLESLAALATDSSERAALDDLANDLSASSEYEALTMFGIFSVVDALERFSKLPVTLEYLLSYAPRITPRTYSLASDSSYELVFNERAMAVGDRIHHGLATHMMGQLEKGHKLTISFAPSGLATMPDPEKPLAIVALGTGIASARMLLQHRHHYFQMQQERGKVGNVVMYYGFRHAGKDELFTDEIEAYVKEGWLDVRKTASRDQAPFLSPIDVMDASLADFVGRDGHISYCGLGGEVPLLVENKLGQVGVDVAALRVAGRYHEEAYSRDPDVENLFLERRGDALAPTLAGRMGRTDMFCFQCEQTHKGRGCHKIGVCGKTPRVAALQDLVVHGVKVMGFYAHELHQLGGLLLDDDDANRLMLEALFATLTNVNFDEARFVDLASRVAGTTEKLKTEYLARCAQVGAVAKTPSRGAFISVPKETSSADVLVELGKGVGILQRFGDPNSQSSEGVREMLTYAIKGIAAYADHSLVNNREDPEIYAFLRKALAYLATEGVGDDLAAGLALCLEAGKANVAAMSLLYDSHATSLGVPSPHAVPLKPKPGKAILVSGHDLVLLKALLEATEPLGINVYTHGEMLPAHGYPGLRKYSNLAGHYGGAWMRQSVEFPHFKGAILVTTNCLTEPHDTYDSRLFTAGAVGWPGVAHIGNDLSDVDFSPLVRAAIDAPGFDQSDVDFGHPDPVGQKRRPESLTVGFGHEALLGAAGTIVDEIKNGNVTRFYVVGGCDGFEGQRSYYTDLVANLEPTAVVLTLGCGKYRVNHLDLGTIGDTGIPRLLDVGQCNDAFSAVQVALALAQALDCEVKDLPLSIVLSWFEQKAIAVLLSCLHLGLKPIHLGPALPAFVTPEVLHKLVTDFGIVPIGDAAVDAKAMAAAPGAS